MIQIKKKLVILGFLTLQCSLAFAQSETLKPLSSFVTEASPDASRVSYIMARCSAIYMRIQIIAESSNPELAKKYESAGQMALYKFVSYSEMASKEKNPNYKAPEDIATKAAETVRNISRLYKPLLDNSYAATGSYFSNPVVMGDLEVCQKLLNAQ